VKYLRDLMATIPHAEYYNLYGPTETNVITYYKTPVLDSDRTAPVPIGRPCDGYEVFALAPGGGVVDRPDVRGELYAAGPCVARGYWGDPEKTAKHFVQHPLRPGSGDVAYATGDHVELDGNGDFVFFGRHDDMIKSRGYRIELAEIEQVLYGHTRVREAAVVAIPDELIGNRIAAFVVMDGAGDDDEAELRRFCLERLPKYMVPELVEFRRGLPKTSTGKVDKKILANDH
jgi:acyl-coenzyme A synthetase/AMP-(fatty) acid ligase